MSERHGDRRIGHVEAIYRYPVKSMAGEARDAAAIGWHGLDGDRRFAIRRVDEPGGMPWLTASRLRELVCFAPVRRGVGDDDLPTHVRTPDGRELPILGDELAAELARRHGRPVHLMRLDRGIFDDGAVSVIGLATIAALAAACGHAPDARRFRPNVVLRTDAPRAFEEDAWVGGALVFGDERDGGGGDAGPIVHVTSRDERCAMLGLDPDTAASDPAYVRAAVRLNANCAGVYATVTRRGRVAVGQPVYLRA